MLLTELVKTTSRPGPSDVLAAQSEAHSQISKAAQRAAHLNESVYNERIPALEALPSITPKAIVKPLKLSELHMADPASSASAAASAERSGGGHADDPFHNLVPLAVLGDVSVYTARRDDRLREMSAVREDAAQLAASELASMDLPHAIEAAMQGPRIPSPLAATLTRLTGNGGPLGLKESIEDLVVRARDMESLVHHVDAMLEVEEGADRQLQAVHGNRWRALPSAQLNADTRTDLSTLKAKLAAAAEADAGLRSAFDASAEALEPLMVPYAMLCDGVPTGHEGLATLPCTQDVVALIQSLETTGHAMDAALADARAACTDADVDSVTDELVYGRGSEGLSSDVIINSALSRLDPFDQRLRAEIAQQECFLGALRTANEGFTRACCDDSTLEARQAYFERLGAAAKAHEDIECMIEQGCSFYEQVEQALDALHRRVAGLAGARAIERQELLLSIQAEAEERAAARANDTLAHAASVAPSDPSASAGGGGLDVASASTADSPPLTSRGEQHAPSHGPHALQTAAAQAIPAPLLSERDHAGVPLRAGATPPPPPTIHRHAAIGSSLPHDRVDRAPPGAEYCSQEEEEQMAWAMAESRRSQSHATSPALTAAGASEEEQMAWALAQAPEARPYAFVPPPVAPPSHEMPSLHPTAPRAGASTPPFASPPPPPSQAAPRAPLMAMQPQALVASPRGVPPPAAAPPVIRSTMPAVHQPPPIHPPPTHSPLTHLPPTHLSPAQPTSAYLPPTHPRPIHLPPTHPSPIPALVRPTCSSADSRYSTSPSAVPRAPAASTLPTRLPPSAASMPDEDEQLAWALRESALESHGGAASRCSSSMSPTPGSSMSPVPGLHAVPSAMRPPSVNPPPPPPRPPPAPAPPPPPSAASALHTFATIPDYRPATQNNPTHASTAPASVPPPPAQPPHPRNAPQSMPTPRPFGFGAVPSPPPLPPAFGAAPRAPPPSHGCVPPPPSVGGAPPPPTVGGAPPPPPLTTGGVVGGLGVGPGGQLPRATPLPAPWDAPPPRWGGPSHVTAPPPFLWEASR